MKMFQLKTFAETMKPILLFDIVFLTGSVAPFKSDRVNTILETVNLVVSLTVFTYLSYVQHLYREYLVQQKILVNYAFAIIWWMTTYSTIAILIIVTKFQTKSMREIFDAVEKIDQKMETIGLPRQYCAQFKYQMLHLCVWIWQFLIYTVMAAFNRLKPTTPMTYIIILSVAVHVVQHVIGSVQLSFTVRVRYIGSKFRQLNELLDDMIEALDSPMSERFLEKSDGRSIKRRIKNDLRGNVEIILKARKCHLELIEIARRMNKFHGVQLLLAALSALVSIMLVLYIFNCFIWYPVDKTDLLEEAVCVLVYAIIIIMRIIHLHSNCIYATNEAKAAGFLLCRLYDSSTSTKFRAEVQNFTQQVLRNPLMFSILGLVDFDRSFLPSMAGCIFAYLFVMVQLASTQWYFRQELTANATDVNLTIIVDN